MPSGAIFLHVFLDEMSASPAHVLLQVPADLTVLSLLSFLVNTGKSDEVDSGVSNVSSVSDASRASKRPVVVSMSPSFASSANDLRASLTADRLLCLVLPAVHSPFGCPTSLRRSEDVPIGHVVHDQPYGDARDRPVVIQLVAISRSAEAKMVHLGNPSVTPRVLDSLRGLLLMPRHDSLAAHNAAGLQEVREMFVPHLRECQEATTRQMGRNIKSEPWLLSCSPQLQILPFEGLIEGRDVLVRTAGSVRAALLDRGEKGGVRVASVYVPERAAESPAQAAFGEQVDDRLMRLAGRAVAQVLFPVAGGGGSSAEGAVGTVATVAAPGKNTKKYPFVRFIQLGEVRKGIWVV